MKFTFPTTSPSSPGASPGGFALPMTILAVAGLTLLLVGLLTVMTLERKTARSYSDSARAELAVESGLAVALASLTEIASRDDSIVFRLEDPVNPQVATDERPLGYREQFFTYGAVFKSDINNPSIYSWRGIPLFSGAEEIQMDDAVEVNEPSEISINFAVPGKDSVATAVAEYTVEALDIGRLSKYDQNIPQAKWVEVPTSQPNDYTFRYSFWVEDLSGRIQGRDAGVLPRADGLGTAELEYATILDPVSDTPVLPAALTEKREKLLTSGSIRSLFTDDLDKRLEPYLHFLTAPAGPKPRKIIPQGFGYQDAGEPAPDINKLVKDKDVEGIADIITRNIPTFEQRRGGFPASEDYVKTIAASVIDYADTDNNATTGPGYRGVDSYPFVNELFDRYEWVSSPPGTVSIDVDTYLELWNPSNQTSQGSFTFNNVNKRRIKLGGNGEKDFDTAEFGPIAADIPPNGFQVVHLGKKNYRFSVDIEPAEPLTFNADDTESSFEFFWNGSLVDFPRGGVERTYSFLRAGLSQRRWKGNSSPSNDLDKGQTGDPRASFYLNEYFYRSDYDGNSSWGGRSIKRDISPKNPFREVRLEKWPDRGSNSTVGIAAGTDARVPTETRIIVKSTGAPVKDKEYPLHQPELAPARISNSGSYKSLGELGNIFDPAQWNELEKSSHSASEIAGGGITLAIGRPEYAAFDKAGRRAAQLLDLFSLEQPEPRTSPPININTAPREVLRSLLAGVKLDADPVATQLGITKKPADPTIGDIFADQVIAYRNGRPLRSVSDLNLIRNKPLTPRRYDSPLDQPYFGNPENYTDVPKIAERKDASKDYDQTDYKDWNDSGREELFKKVMDLVSYRSNIFRIVVAGEVLDPSGKATSRSVREYQIGVSPQRDADGKIIPGSPPVITKYYESSL